MNAVPPNSLFIKKPFFPVTGNARRNLLLILPRNSEAKISTGLVKTFQPTGFFSEKRCVRQFNFFNVFLIIPRFYCRCQAFIPTMLLLSKLRERYLQAPLRLSKFPTNSRNSVFYIKILCPPCTLRLYIKSGEFGLCRPR